MEKILIRLNIIGQIFIVYLFGDFLHKSNERSSSVDDFFCLVKGVKLGRMVKCTECMRSGTIYFHLLSWDQWFLVGWL